MRNSTRTRKEKMFFIITDRKVLEELNRLVAAIDNLTANVQKLSTDVAALVAKLQAAPSEAAVQAQADAVAQIDSQVVTALGQ